MKNRIETLWMLADSTNTGGAESRMIKVASKLANDNNIGKIKILVNEELKKKYHEHNILSKLLDHPKIEIEIYSEKPNTLINQAGWVLSRLGIHLKLFEKIKLKKNSWFTYLRDNVGENDVVHCYIGDNARNGIYLFTEKYQNKAVVEITNNRYLERVSTQLKLISKEGRKYQNLYIRSVSKNVHQNWLTHFSTDWFKTKNIDCDFYKGAFINLKRNSGNPEKQNLIISPHRFVKPKNGFLFSQVIKELLEEGKLNGWKVLLRGTGPQEGKIRANLEAFTGNGNVDIGFSSNLFNDLQRGKIVVSLIKTGTYPSQSIFEAMQAGCALLLSNSGNTMEEYNHQRISFTRLEKDEIKKKLLLLTNKANGELENIGMEMKQYFKWFLENRNQLNEILDIYFSDSVNKK